MTANPGCEEAPPPNLSPRRLSIERIAAGGDGVGREENGRVVFVPRTAPGDVAQVELIRSRERWARGRLVDLEQRGSERRVAPCPVYDGCGGCQLQHLVPESQRQAKRGLVRDAFERIGGMTVPVPEVISGGGDLAYRNRVTFSVGTGGGSAPMGLRRFEDPGRVLDLDLCLLAERPVQEAWRGLRDASRRGSWTPAASADTRLTVRAARDGLVDLTVWGSGEPGGAEAEALLEGVPGLIGVHAVDEDGSTRCIAGAATLADRWQGVEFELPAGVFMQVNREVSEAMDRWLDAKVGPVSGMRVIDLYSGVGARAVRWALKGASVTACEVSRAAAGACEAAAAKAGTALRVVASRVEDLVPVDAVDLVVVNPPRAGLSRSVSRALQAQRAGRMAYVSCDPATLARDVARLEPSWSLAGVQPFDAFPQTAHVETIAWLERR